MASALAIGIMFIVITKTYVFHINFQLLVGYYPVTNKYYYVFVYTTAPLGWKLKMLFFWKTSKVKWCNVFHNGKMYTGLINKTNMTSYDNNLTLFADEILPDVLELHTRETSTLPSLDSFFWEVRPELWGISKPWGLILQFYISIYFTYGSGIDPQYTFVASYIYDFPGPEGMIVREWEALELLPLVIKVGAQKNTFHNRATIFTIHD